MKTAYVIKHDFYQKILSPSPQRLRVIRIQYTTLATLHRATNGGRREKVFALLSDVTRHGVQTQFYFPCTSRVISVPSLAGAQNIEWQGLSSPQHFKEILRQPLGTQDNSSLSCHRLFILKSTQTVPQLRRISRLLLTVEARVRSLGCPRGFCERGIGRYDSLRLVAFPCKPQFPHVSSGTGIISLSKAAVSWVSASPTIIKKNDLHIIWR
jgi:hypothetical protein